MYSSFQRRLVGYSGERFRSGNEVKSECIHHFIEDWLLWRAFLIGK